MYNGKLHDFLPMLVYCCCDLPARASLQEFKFSTGKSACPMCLHNGYPIKEQKRTMYRYGKESKPSELRTHATTIIHAHSKSNGVKKLSCLMTLPNFDIINSFATDYMHGSALGVMKRFIVIILGQHKVDKRFQPMAKSKQDELNRRICALKPYAKITHKPRTLEAMGSYRAIEYKYLMFFYLRYCMRNLLSHKYVQHFELFSAAVYILCQQTLQGEDIHNADKMLNQFCDQFEEYYGLAAVTLNVHLLRHYGAVVRNTWPLWCHSLFAFEANMGILTEYASGSVHVVDQVAQKYIISRGISNTQALNTNIMPCTFITDRTIDEEYNDLLRSKGIKDISKKATSIKINNTVYKSLHSNVTQNCDYFVEMMDGVLGIAVFYPIQDNKIYILLKVYEVVTKNYHLCEVRPNSEIFVYPIEAIKFKLLYLIFGSTEIISMEPNKYERT